MAKSDIFIPDHALILTAALTGAPEEEECRLGFVRPLLSTEQQDGLSRSRRAVDRALRFLVRALLLEGLNYFALDGPKLLRNLAWNDKGQPNLGNLKVSFSHSFPYGFCAIAKTPVGVDVEGWSRDLDPADFGVVFGPREMEAIQAVVNPNSELIRRFTIKESILKALGGGFLLNPFLVDSSEPRNSKCLGALELNLGHLDLSPDFWFTWSILSRSSSLSPSNSFVRFMEPFDRQSFRRQINIFEFN
ncbi:MAG: 4'-phosphopantetheinyl transferase superfamily protein [Deltaproteobacteria bacterium]|jgi:phosphopantetheinyl transferase|nr:4'-phosphopantetheinyl transferase superfamily protein [Deltaproteobacteria bacterium]